MLVIADSIMKRPV